MIVLIPAKASSVICSSATGTSNVFTNQSCSPLFTATSTLDWGSAVQGSVAGAAGSNLGGLGDASVLTFPKAVGTTLNAAVDGDAFTIQSNDQLVRADNTAMAWSSTYNSWVPAAFVNSNNIYQSGHFGAPTTPSSQPQFGDNLLGALAPSGNSHGYPTITFTFAQALSYVAFQVSSAFQSNFTAELLAFDSHGSQLGIYKIQDTGDGGNCAGLSASTGPQPCNTAPLIQFYDPNTQISSVELVMLNDMSGVFIDSLQVAPVPEPGTIGLMLFGTGCVFLVSRRRRGRGRSAGLRP
jgi:hypothetical protein